MKVKIDWIRHGQSYSNLFYDLGGMVPNFTDADAQQFSSIYTPDAKLTPTGILQARYFNRKYRYMAGSYDFLFCSELYRSVETAILVSRYTHIKKIYMMPYISELRLPDMSDHDNQPSDHNMVKEEMTKKYPASCGYAKVDTSFIEKYHEPNKFSIPNQHIFHGQIVPSFLKYMGIHDMEQVYIGTVSHREYIHNIFEIRYGYVEETRLENLQYMTEIIKYDGGTITWSNMLQKSDQTFPTYLKINNAILCRYIQDIL